MSNKFSGRCSECGRQVSAGAGACTKQDGRWVVRHSNTEACQAARAAFAAATVAVPTAERAATTQAPTQTPRRGHTYGDGYCPACGDEGCYADRGDYHRDAIAEGI